MTEPSLTATAGGTELLAPLIAQWDTSLAMLVDRLDGLDDDEYRWSPVPGAADLVPSAGGALVAAGNEGGEPVRTIAWTLAHLSDLCLKRADWTDGTHRLDPAYDPFPAAAGDGVTAFRAAAARWRSTLAHASAEQARQVGYSAYPPGLDRDLPFVDIAWWCNRELIHHGADVATLRDLYTALGG